MSEVVGNQAGSIEPDSEQLQVLFVPARPVHQDDAASYGVEVRRLSDGQYGCLAFTSVERLVGTLGMYQPWVGVAANELALYLDARGVEALYVDSGLPEHAWRWQPDHLDALEQQEGHYQ